MALGPRVLQVVISLNPGGTERLLVELANRLHVRIPMMVCCLDGAGTWATELRANGIEVQALERRPGFRPALGLAIARAARRHGASIVHAHQYSPFVYSALARLRAPSTRVVFTEHGRLSDAPPSAKRRAANWVLAKAPRRVFAVSRDLRQHMIDEGFGAADVGVIYNGIDAGPLPDAHARARTRRQLAVADDAVVIGTIGRLDPVKGFDTLVRSVAELNSPVPVHLVIIGNGSERDRLERLVRELRVESRVRLLGHRDDARAWLAACDVYVNSSISEGVSLTILEAMAAGLPVIATRVGGTPEVVDRSCGLLVPARDTGALTRALGIVSSDPGLRQRLGRSARSRVETHFTLDRMIQEYADVYQSLAARPSRQGLVSQG